MVDRSAIWPEVTAVEGVSRTALGSAYWRAAHLRDDPPPWILEDRIAARLLGDDDIAELEGPLAGWDHAVVAGFRLAHAVRARVAEDVAVSGLDAGRSIMRSWVPASTRSPGGIPGSGQALLDGLDRSTVGVLARAIHRYLTWRNANTRDPRILEAERRHRARIRSEQQRRWGRPRHLAA
jgi:hypothetical protein